MKFKDVPANVLLQVANYRWDRIIEKHEGPWDWKYDVKDDYLEFMDVDGFDVLLPIDKQNHVNVTIDRCIPSKDGDNVLNYAQIALGSSCLVGIVLLRTTLSKQGDCHDGECNRKRNSGR